MMLSIDLRCDTDVRASLAGRLVAKATQCFLQIRPV